jgi:DegV family protein with EDD domain
MIFIGIGSKLSGTMQSAYLAKAELPERRIYPIDSQNLSSGIGLLVLKAAELRNEGIPIEKIVKEIEITVPKVRTAFIIDTLDYLYKGGRCSALSNFIGSMLRIRPVIAVRDGALGVKDKIGGSRKKALDSLLVDFKKNLPQIDLHRVFVTHTGCDDDAIYLKTGLMEIAPIEEIDITYAGATISSHCGPNTIGILYILK